MDAEYAACGAPFEPALFLAATVISAARKTHVTIDSGLKALSVEVAPRLVAGAPTGAHFRFMGDEHGAVLHPSYLARLASAGDSAAQAAAVGAIQADPDCPYPDNAPALGARVWLQPGHVDPTINLHSVLIIAENGAIVDRWAIAARR
jgi:3-hydroxy-D-aspartate aldolase